MEQIQIETLNQTIDRWSQLTFGMGALLVVFVLVIVLALVVRGVFKREEREDKTESQSLELASQAFKTLLDRLPTWVEQMSVSTASLVTSMEAQNTTLATLRATANHHTSAFQTTQASIAALDAQHTQQNSTLESIRRLLEEVAASTRLLARNVENIPAATVAALTPQLEAMRSTTALAVGEAIEAKRATDEQPTVKVEGEVKPVIEPPPASTLPPDMHIVELTKPEGTAQ